jgi:hypothetical protein
MSNCGLAVVVEESGFGNNAYICLVLVLVIYREMILSGNVLMGVTWLSCHSQFRLCWMGTFTGSY